ncbi:MAG: M56 family metallopeptidase [Gemmatimonadaceae bacterium]|jgi:beta-lactamase regulating signal transducer with metallopeptidase domain
MMILWLAYSIVVGALIAAAARLVERAALVFGRATRYVWVAAMLLMLGTSIGSLGFRAYEQQRANSAAAAQSGATATATAPAVWWQSLVPAEASTARASFATALSRRIAALTERLSPFDRTVFVLWALLTTFVGALVLHATLEGRRLLHASEAREVKGMRVLVTDALGPAAVGLGATAVLMPRWALELEDQLLDLVLRHEREHLEAHDPALLFYGLVFIVLLPWLLPLWWAWQRLRLAIEVDCDARLLRDERDTRRYAQLLLLMSQRIAGPRSVIQPFITVTAPLQPELTHLATRIRIMTEVKGRHALRSVVLLMVGVVASGSLALAIPVPRPTVASHDARPAQSDGRAIVRVTSVGMHGVEWASDGTLKGEVLIFTTGGAKVGIGSGELKAIRDTLHLKSLPGFTADVTDGEVHIRLVGSKNGTIELTATVTGGPATSLSGRDSYLVLMKGGTGIKTMLAAPPMFIVDGERTTQEAAMKIPRDSMASVEVLKGEVAVAKLGAYGKNGVVMITTKRNDIPDARAANAAQPSRATDSTRTYFEFQVDEPVQIAPGSGAPKYPAAEKAAGVEATVLVQFVVGPDGLAEPGSFRVIRGTRLLTPGGKQVEMKPESDYGPFELAIRDAMPTLRFLPGKLKGVAVRQLVQQPYVFAIAKK